MEQQLQKRNEVTCDLEFDKQWGGLKRKWTHIDVESLFGHFRVLKYGASFGYLKFDMWKWHTRKKIRGTQCKVKLRKWKFDMWKWPKRKKDRGKELCVELVFCWNEGKYKIVRSVGEGCIQEGGLNKSRVVGEYLIEIWEAAGMDVGNVKFLWASAEII